MLDGFCKINCFVCNTTLIRRNGWVLENKRLGHKAYCSSECLSKGRTTKVVCICNNPSCKKTFLRVLSALGPHNYCSRSCCATITNTYRKKEKPPYIFTPRPTSKYTKKSIVGAIQAFVVKNQRIPVKRELNAECCAAKRLFGTWNKAICVAGFHPNKNLFSRRYCAKDGHMCDSFAEKIIDNWLFDRHIPHRVHIPYFYKNMSADFSIGNTIIEYFGLNGNMRKYDAHVEIKKELWKRRNLNVIDIYPNDLFPKNKLITKLSHLLPDQ